MAEAILRQFARHQWIRVNGTPRVTVLVGGTRGRVLWRQWLSMGALDGALFDGALATAACGATARAVANPAIPIAVSCTTRELTAWRTGRTDRLAAMIDEGVVPIPDDDSPARNTRQPATPDARRSSPFNARSAAEAAMYEALEATPATAGRFELNGYLSVRFGSNAAEVDLISRRDGIAIEIDGYCHFGDLNAYRRDRKKDLLLQTQGLLVVRVLAQDVMRDARPAVAAVCQAIASRL
jgi:hypothetical protein